MLDDLYWVMSYSRWKDERFWPLFRYALLEQHPTLTEEGLNKAREFNFQRYHFQGIGRYQPEEASPAALPMCWRISCREAAICTAAARLSSTRASMASSPIAISTPSTRR